MNHIKCRGGFVFRYPANRRPMPAVSVPDRKKGQSSGWDSDGLRHHGGKRMATGVVGEPLGDSGCFRPRFELHSDCIGGRQVEMTPRIANTPPTAPSQSFVMASTIMEAFVSSMPF